MKISDLRTDMKTHSLELDFSEYPKRHSLYSATNEKVLGKFKKRVERRSCISVRGSEIEDVSIKSSKKEKKRAKGI